VPVGGVPHAVIVGHARRGLCDGDGARVCICIAGRDCNGGDADGRGHCCWAAAGHGHCDSFH
jgi:hypothetical protein